MEKVNGEKVKEEDKEKVKEGIKEKLSSEEEIKAEKVQLRDRIDKLLGRKAPSTSQERKPLEKPKEKEVEEPKTIEGMWEDGDQVGATRRMIHETVEGISKEASRKEGATEARERALSIRNQANRLVWEKHPEILEVDEGTKEAKDVPLYQEIQKVYQEFPELMEQLKGPQIAMEMAEKRFGGSEERRIGAEEEHKRQERTGLHTMVSSSSSSRPAPPMPKVNLTDDQKAVASKLGVTESDYASNLTRTPVFSKEYYRNSQVPPKPRGA